MKPVVKYGVYWDILLRVPIYVTKYICFKENPKNHKICQSAARRSGRSAGTLRTTVDAVSNETRGLMYVCRPIASQLRSAALNKSI